MNEQDDLRSIEELVRFCVRSLIHSLCVSYTTATGVGIYLYIGKERSKVTQISNLIVTEDL